MIKGYFKNFDVKDYVIFFGLLILILIFMFHYILYGSGFHVEKGVLKYYDGSDKNIIVPFYVKEIGPDAFSGDVGPGENLVKVVVPGNVKKVDSMAFNFTYADYIYFEEGVEELGGSIFSDAYIKEVHFPRSIKKCGGRIMETEEGIKNVKIYVKKGSYMEEYFKEYDPYPSAGWNEVIVEDD